MRTINKTIRNRYKKKECFLGKLVDETSPISRVTIKVKLSETPHSKKDIFEKLYKITCDDLIARSWKEL